jgi:hypothetical protein
VKRPTDMIDVLNARKTAAFGKTPMAGEDDLAEARIVSYDEYRLVLPGLDLDGGDLDEFGSLLANNGLLMLAAAAGPEDIYHALKALTVDSFVMGVLYEREGRRP